MNKTYLSEKILLRYILDKDIYPKGNDFYCTYLNGLASYLYLNGEKYIIDFAGVRTYYQRFLWIWYNKREIPSGYSVIFKNNNRKDTSKKNIGLINTSPLILGREILKNKRNKNKETKEVK